MKATDQENALDPNQVDFTGNPDPLYFTQRKTDDLHSGYDSVIYERTDQQDAETSSHVTNGGCQDVHDSSHVVMADPSYLCESALTKITDQPDGHEVCQIELTSTLDVQESDGGEIPHQKQVQDMNEIQLANYQIDQKSSETTMRDQQDTGIWSQMKTSLKNLHAVDMQTGPSERNVEQKIDMVCPPSESSPPTLTLQYGKSKTTAETSVPSTTMPEDHKASTAPADIFDMLPEGPDPRFKHIFLL